jgi:hypothetical protein
MLLHKLREIRRHHFSMGHTLLDRHGMLKLGNLSWPFESIIAHVVLNGLPRITGQEE